MTFREKLADWLTGGELAVAKVEADQWQRRAEISGFQAHEATGNAFVLQVDLNEQRKISDRFSDALQKVIAARNITEARKIAQDALNMDNGNDAAF